jgi:hypothetical protein
VEMVDKLKVMNALFKVEGRYPHLGKSMLPIFFTENLCKDEQAKWDNYETIEKERKEKARIEDREKQVKPNNLPNNQQASSSDRYS